MVFNACVTQWRISSAAGAVKGLKYGAIKRVMKWLNVKKKMRSDTYLRIHIMELAVVSAFAEQARAEKSRAFHR